MATIGWLKTISVSSLPVLKGRSVKPGDQRSNNPTSGSKGESTLGLSVPVTVGTP